MVMKQAQLIAKEEVPVYKDLVTESDVWPPWSRLSGISQKAAQTDAKKYLNLDEVHKRVIGWIDCLYYQPLPFA